MADRLRITRVETKLIEMFGGKIDVSDLPSGPKKDGNVDHFISRALAALAIQICSGVDALVAAGCITDGYNDLGIDGVYKDEEQKSSF